MADVRLFMALREAAHQRLFSHVPWLRQQLHRRGGRLRPRHRDRPAGDLGGAQRHRSEQPGVACSNALAGGLFEPENTDAQNAALRRLETLLALIEGWVDAVVAPGGRRPAAGRRRRWPRRCGAGAPRAGRPSRPSPPWSGLELRPRRLRDAAALWGGDVPAARTSARDGLWNHPDLLPERRRPRRPAELRGRLRRGSASCGCPNWTIPSWPASGRTRGAAECRTADRAEHSGREAATPPERPDAGPRPATQDGPDDRAGQARPPSPAQVEHRTSARASHSPDKPGS